MLRILGKASSINVRKVLWTCAELGIPFVREDWGAGFESTRQPEFLALNPNAMVPVLIDSDSDGDVVLWESNTICRYLVGRYGQDTALLPSEPVARARVEQWMDWQATDLNNAWRYAFMALARNSAAHSDAAQIDISAVQWNHHMGILEGQLGKTGAYAAGDAFSLADVVLGLSVYRWMKTPIARPDYPAIAAYAERLLPRPGCREFCMNGVA